MNEIDIKEFYGNIYDNKAGEGLGRALVILKIEREIPKDVTIYYDSNIIYGSSSSFTNLKIISHHHEVYITSSSTSIHERSGGLNTSAVYIKPSRISIITKHDYTIAGIEANQANIYLRTNDIEYLEYNLSSFKVAAMDNLKQLGPVIEEYKIQLKNSLENFSYQPGVRIVRNNTKNDEILYFDHFFNFGLFSELNHEEFLKYVEGIAHIISFIINVLSKKDFDYRSVYIQRCYEGDYFAYEIYNKEKIYKTHSSNVDINYKDFLNVFNKILDWYLKANDKEQTTFRVIFNRFMQIKKESDISLRITFIHLIFNHLVKNFYKGQIRLYDDETINKILNCLDIKANKGITDNIKSINYYRNQFFKETKLNMKDYDDIFEKYNFFIDNVLVPTLSKFLSVNEINKTTLNHILKHVFCI